jgi:hypothetical protein
MTPIQKKCIHSIKKLIVHTEEKEPQFAEVIDMFILMKLDEHKLDPEELRSYIGEEYFTRYCKLIKYTGVYS